ncbi:MAG: general stress protein [Alkalibacterium sp.]
MDKKLIGGVFSNADNAEKAIRDLQNIGFTKDDISIFAKDDSQVDKIEDDTNTSVDASGDSKGSKAGKGTGLGALSGGVLGGIVGLIAEVGLLAIPGIGPIAAAGPLATTLAGLGTGAVGGGIVGALVGAGMPEEEAKEYERYLKDGKIIVMVEVTPEQQAEVYSTFRTHNTENASMYR